DYASAADVLADIERAEADVEARLAAIARALPSARAFADSVARDRERHRRERAQVRMRLGLPPAVTAGPPSADVSLSTLRDAQQALVTAHAEGLMALREARAVDVLARHMVDGQRALTVIDLWRDSEGARG